MQKGKKFLTLFYLKIVLGFVGAFMLLIFTVDSKANKSKFYPEGNVL